MDALSYDALVRTLGRLHAQASFLRVEVIGRSVCGRGLFALRLGSRRSGALYAAGFDGSRQTAGAALLRWVETLCRCLQTGTPLCGVDLAQALEQSGVTVLPCLNPDGMEIAANGARGAGSLRAITEPLLHGDEPWRFNAVGVQLDHQFPFAFERLQERQTSSENKENRFGGAPLTEPEARALARFCRRERFDRAMVLEEGPPLLSVFPAGGKPAARETVVAAKILAACVGAPFMLPALQDCCGMFSPWFADELQQNAFTLSLESEGAAFERRIEEALVLFSVL